MATRPSLNIAVQGTKNTAAKYNENFNLMMDFIDDSLAESKNYVDGYMPSVTGQAGKVLATDGTNAIWAVAVPVGTVLHYGGAYAPAGWLVCDGSAISRTTYADLYSAIGTAYGEGDGETTFNLPDLIDKFIEGSETVGIEKEAGLPNLIGWLVAWTNNRGNDRADGTLFTRDWLSTNSATHNNGEQYVAKFDFNASRLSPIYGNSTTVQPPSVTMLSIIKY